MKNMKTITLYGSALCPRCLMAKRSLNRLRQSEGLEIKVVDVMRHPLQSSQAGIRMIPAIKAGDKILSGLYLSEKAIQAFLNNNGDHS